MTICNIMLLTDLFQVPKTIENTRIEDDSKVDPKDIEIIGDEKDDEFSPYYNDINKVSNLKNIYLLLLVLLWFIHLATKDYDFNETKMLEKII